MNRCAIAALALLAFALPCSAQQGLRAFPAQALRGELLIGQPPQATLNGQPARLAPGARIRGENNLLLMSGAAANQPLVVHYTRDEFGLLKDIWVLTPEERARRPWPSTPAEASSWLFDPVGQTWRKP